MLDETMSSIESKADDNTAREPVHMPMVAFDSARMVAVAIETLVAVSFVTPMAPAPLSALCRRN
ncbi:MAG: hypothetical protein AB7E76_01065 [Deferribacterales bacterium]